MNSALQEIIKKYSDPSTTAAELHRIERDLENAAMEIRRLRRAKSVAIDCSLAFRGGEYLLEIGDLKMAGNTAQFCDAMDRKAIHCRFGDDECRSWRRDGTCRYRHTGEPVLLRQNEKSFLLRSFLSLPNEFLGAFHRMHPDVAGELKAFKERILDGVIRLLWLRSEGINV